MNKRHVYYVAKFLEGAGMIVVLVGLLLSIRLGLEDESLASQRWSLEGLLAGAGLFALGYLLERVVGTR